MTVKESGTFLFSMAVAAAGTTAATVGVSSLVFSLGGTALFPQAVAISMVCGALGVAGIYLVTRN